MRKLTAPRDFITFLETQRIDSNKIEYISKDCESYKVRNLDTGKVGYIRY